MTPDDFPDGLEALQAELKLDEIMRLIERTAAWVDPETFRLLPVWYPEHARRALFYKANWSEPQLNRNRETGDTIHKREGNLYANKALTKALGLKSQGRQNWSCCHIWGVDDAAYQSSNRVVQDRRFYSCVANMVLLPTPLKAFTDTMPEVKAMLRICARATYGWSCDHENLDGLDAQLDSWADWSAWPASWPRTIGDGQPLGVRPLTKKIKKDAKARLAAIRKDLREAGQYYPREDVRKALDYWGIAAEASTAM